MGRYDSHKHPFQFRMNQWARNGMNSAIEKLPKSMPVHVVEQAQDFIKVAFETANGIFSMPIVKIAQAMSQYGREPTQVGDKGHATFGSYYLGGVSGMAGGNTDFYPRGNLSTLNFNGISHVLNPGRNFNQLTHMGGPEGWITRAFEAQQQGQQGSQSESGQGPAASAAMYAMNTDRARRMNIHRAVMGQRKVYVKPLDSATAGGTQGGQSQQQQQQDNGPKGTNFNFDKNNLCTMQSKDTDHNVTVDSQNKKITLNLPVGEWGYAGGDGQKGKYAQIMTTSGPSVNFKARIG